MPDQKYEDRLKDYVDVKERVRLFYERYPDGRLVTDRVEIWQDDEIPRIFVAPWPTAPPTIRCRRWAGPGWCFRAPRPIPAARSWRTPRHPPGAGHRLAGHRHHQVDRVDGRGRRQGRRGRAQVPGAGRRRPAQTADGSLIGMVGKGARCTDMQLRPGRRRAVRRLRPAPGPPAAQGRGGGPAGRRAGALPRGPHRRAGHVLGHGRARALAQGRARDEPYKRLQLERIATDDWVMPRVDLVEAPTTPLFPDEAA